MPLTLAATNSLTVSVSFLLAAAVVAVVVPACQAAKASLLELTSNSLNGNCFYELGLIAS